MQEKVKKWERTGQLPTLFVGLVLFLDVEMCHEHILYKKGVRCSEQDGISGPHYCVCVSINGEQTKWVPISHGGYSTSEIPANMLKVRPMTDPLEYFAEIWLNGSQKFRIEEAIFFPDIETLRLCADSAKNTSEVGHEFYIVDKFVADMIIPNNKDALEKI